MAFPNRGQQMSNSRRAYPGYEGDRQMAIAPARIAETRPPGPRQGVTGRADTLRPQRARKALLAGMKGGA